MYPFKLPIYLGNVICYLCFLLIQIDVYVDFRVTRKAAELHSRRGYNIPIVLHLSIIMT